MTYNQSKYIEDALRGFAIQQTNFPFVCLVMDDASTDGEQEAIKAFLDNECDMNHANHYDIEDATVVIAQHKSNHSCTFAVYLLKKNLYKTPRKKQIIDEWRDNCKYEALCEGDDYWTSPNKLQKQVFFLNSNPEYSMCCSNALIDSPYGILDWTYIENNQRVSPETIIEGGGLFIQTASLIYRRSLLNDYPDCCKECHVGDYPLKIWGALHGLYYFSDKDVVYRYLAQGSWTAKQRRTDIELDKLAKGWRSEIDMLQGLNEYSNHQFQSSFERRQANYIFNELLKRNSNWKELSSQFDDVVSLFNIKQKAVHFCKMHGLFNLYLFYRKLHKNFSHLRK